MPGMARNACKTKTYSAAFFTFMYKAWHVMHVKQTPAALAAGVR